MKLWAMLFGSILSVAAAPPPDAVTKADLRCLMAMAALADNEDPELKQAGAAGTLYFLGRLDGRSPALDIEAALAELSVTDKDIGPLLKSCGSTLEKRGDQLIAVGKALEKRGK